MKLLVFSLQQDDNGPYKRGFTAFATGLGVFMDIIGLRSFVYGTTQQRDEDTADIQTKLKQMDVRLDNLGKDVESLAEGQERLAATSLYGKDVTRLRFFLSYLVHHLFQTETGLQPVNRADEWANSVLTLSDDGVAQVCLYLQYAVNNNLGDNGVAQVCL